MSIVYTSMADLLESACAWAPRNFIWAEWSVTMEEVQGNYRPTCLNALIPPDAIAGIQEEVRLQILSGEITSATQRLEQLNGWLQVNGQFKNYGVDVPAFVAGVVATATAEAKPMPAFTPTPSAMYIPQQPISPLGVQQISPLSSPTLTPESNVTPTPPSP